MVNKSGRIGAEAETWVVEYMSKRGWPNADRRKTNGAKDRGDVNSGQSKLVVEVKADKGLNYSEFLRQTEKERVSAGAAVGVCVVKPPGVGKRTMHRWWMLMASGTYDALRMMAGPENFAAWFDDGSTLPGRSFHPGRCLAHAAEGLQSFPGTMLKPGATKIFRTGWDGRFLYLPDGLELLRLAGLAVD